MNIADYIDGINKKDEKVLSIFLTAGFPDKENFAELALGVLEAGADMLEIGFPFSDPLADGPVIQYSSHQAIANGVNLSTVFEYIKIIKAETAKPLILMGYANPVLNYGVSKFLKKAKSAGANGLIIPDVPLEEYDAFFGADQSLTEIIMLTVPSSSEERIKKIDAKSRGFLYCVSVNGVTGERQGFNEAAIESIRKTYELVNNKMLIGFGISNADSIKAVSPYCDGVIIGSAVIKKLTELTKQGNNYSAVFDFIREMKQACSGKLS
ncbi:MAG: tryptophan synthase subunit alpha [Ignavibacteria bacterium]